MFCQFRLRIQTKKYSKHFNFIVVDNFSLKPTHQYHQWNMMMMMIGKYFSIDFVTDQFDSSIFDGCDVVMLLAKYFNVKWHVYEYFFFFFHFPPILKWASVHRCSLFPFDSCLIVLVLSFRSLWRTWMSVMNERKKKSDNIDRHNGISLLPVA